MRNDCYINMQTPQNRHPERWQRLFLAVSFYAFVLFMSSLFVLAGFYDYRRMYPRASWRSFHWKRALKCSLPASANLPRYSSSSITSSDFAAIFLRLSEPSVSVQSPQFTLRDLLLSTLFIATGLGVLRAIFRVFQLPAIASGILWMIGCGLVGTGIVVPLRRWR